MSLRLSVFALFLPPLLALSACQSGPQPLPGQQTVTLDVTRVALPASVAATADLVVSVTVTVGGCKSFQGFAAERSPHELRLTAQGSVPGGHPICPANIGYSDQTYTDPGTPARSDPFEVFVNGKFYGTVVIR